MEAINWLVHADIGRNGVVLVHDLGERLILEFSLHHQLA